MRAAAGWLVVVVFFAAAARGEDPQVDLQTDPQAEWRATMDEIFEAMQVALPLSLDEERFASSEERERLRAALAALAKNADQLEAHGETRDAGSAFLSRSLARDARDIHRRFDAGKLPEARFLLHELTGTCVACHSRLPSDREFPLGERIVDEPIVAALPLDERARYELATRQFDRALETLEAYFVAPGTSPADVNLLGDVDDYLEVVIRVKDEPKRARKTLERFAKRKDLSSSLRTDAKSWIASLRELESRKPKTPALTEARALMDEAQDSGRFADDRTGLVYYVAASAVLQRFIASERPPDRETARAYYLLGVIESRVGRSGWVSQAEAYLESAIRLGPDSEFAPDAFELLSGMVVAGWTGSAGVMIPTDVEERLAELSQLVEESQPAGALP